MFARVAHAPNRENRGSKAVRSTCIWGPAIGQPNLMAVN